MVYFKIIKLFLCGFIDFIKRLEPLLARIKEKRTAVLCPIIDNIDDRTLAYIASGSEGYGIFTWSLFFNWGQIPARIKSKRISNIEPYPSPTMAGGLLAVDRSYFFEIGGYDDGMEGIHLNHSK